jgi:hypothetical protein
LDHRTGQAGEPDTTQFKQKNSLLVEPLPFGRTDCLWNDHQGVFGKWWDLERYELDVDKDGAEALRPMLADL